MSKKLIICLTVLLFSGFIYSKGAFVEVGDPSFFPDGFTDLVSMQIDGDGNVFVAYIQDDYYFSVAKFDGESWSNVGLRRFSGKIGNVPGTPDVWPYSSFTLSSDGVPYVSFPASGTKSLNVMKFNSGSGKWEYVGKSNITDYKTNYTSISVDSEGVPYVVFSGCKSDDCKRVSVDEEEYTIDTSKVMKFNGTEWEYLGDPMKFFENNPINDSTVNNRIVLNSNNVPYIAFSYIENFISVMKYNGTEWEKTGELDEVEGEGLYIDNKDELYLNCYKVYELPNPGVLKLDGDKWNRLADTEEGRNNLTVDKENRIIKTTDLESTGLSVKKLNDEGLWEVIGDKEYIHESVHSALVETDPNNIPYVAFAENGGVVLMKYDPEATETPDDSDDDIVSDEETPVNGKDSGSSGCGMILIN